MISGLKTGLMALLIPTISQATLGAASAGQNNESVSLNIFGNANMDSIIDEQDLAYLEDVIAKTKQSTNLSDTNLDGSIDDRDGQLEEMDD